MKKFHLLLLLLCGVMHGQNNKSLNCKDILNKWHDIFSLEKPSVNNVKKCISKYERKIKIEVINKGNYNDFIQILSVGFTKINNNDFSPILKESENLPNIVIDRLGEEEWRDGYGSMINENSLTVSQSYTGSEDNPNIPLKEIEIYETTVPVLSGVLRIMGTYRKDFDHINPTNLTKTIKVYSDNKLIVSKEYSFEEVGKIGGITLEFSAIEK